jgi:cell wall integrity and stress response component
LSLLEVSGINLIWYTMLIELVGSTVVVTASGSSSSGKSGGSKAGIAAGVVVGIIVVGAIIGGAWFYLRARKRRAVEEEYRRNATINSFIAKPGSASSISDSRLEPSVMMQRRMSDGSIADNQDYSRRILKVVVTYTGCSLQIADDS